MTTAGLETALGTGHRRSASFLEIKSALGVESAGASYLITHAETAASLKRDQQLDLARVGRVEQRRGAQMTLAGAALARQQMAQIGALVLHLAALGYLEALGRAAIGLEFGHTVSRFAIYLTRREQHRHIAPFHAGQA